MSLPNDFPEWAINDPLKVEAPLTTFANEGYGKSKPSYKHFNFFINRLSQLYNAVINGFFNDKGINPYTASLELEIKVLQNQYAELENRVSKLEV